MTAELATLILTIFGAGAGYGSLRSRITGVEVSLTRIETKLDQSIRNGTNSRTPKVDPKRPPRK